MGQVVAGCYQLEVSSGDVESNLVRVGEAVQQMAREGCQLLVLPEMWSCGFAYRHLKDLSARTPAIIESLQEWGCKYRMVLVGSLPEAEGDTIYNTSYVIDNNGQTVGAYRKIHLFSLHKENLHFGRGGHPLVCSTAVGRLGIQICYDLRFPELSRKLVLEGAEILCVSALWPLTRIEHWSLLLRARALENQCFVVGCNGCGYEGQMRYGEHPSLFRLLQES